MSTLADRSKTALLVVDMQRDVIAQAHDVDNVVANIAALVTKARAEQVPVVWIQHEADDLVVGEDGWQIVDELRPEDDEALVAKNYGDSFEATELESILAGHGVARVVVTGAQTDACIRSTLHGALARGYDTTLVADAHTTEDMREWGSPLSPEQAIAYTNLYWSFSKSPGRSGDVAAAADVDFAAT